VTLGGTVLLGGGARWRRRHGASAGRRVEAVATDRWRRFVCRSVSLTMRGEERTDFKKHERGRRAFICKMTLISAWATRIQRGSFHVCIVARCRSIAHDTLLCFYGAADMAGWCS
jgi:hypothetical protein